MIQSFRKLPRFIVWAQIVLLIVGLGLCRSAYALEPDRVVAPTHDTPENTGPTTPSRVLPGERPTAKSYLLPALEIPTFILLLNGVDRLAFGEKDFGSNYRTTRDHFLHGPWVVDQDAFTINQIGHPYQGALYYGFARSAGLNYWESLLFSNAGSVVWELAGETTDPSINDQVASGTGGSFIGESLFRMSNLVLERGGEEPPIWRKVAAALVYPPTLLNRLLFGDRFGPVLESRDPAVFTRLQLGAGSNINVDSPGSARDTKRNIFEGGFQLTYGLPGKPGYRFQRPFDYFDFELQATLENRRHFESLMTRGLLFGRDYEAGEVYRGVWGLYGSFDYLSPQVYRVSTTAVSVGTTGQWWLSRHWALQGTTLTGIGYGAAGTIVPNGDETDYHYGAAPQQLLALRLLWGSRFMLDATGRTYFISGVGASKAHGTEHISRINTSLAVRVYGHHALSFGYLVSHRNAQYTSLPDRHQTVQTITLSYNLLGHANFGAVKWRDGQPD